jgi:hypothetical protein
MRVPLLCRFVSVPQGRLNIAQDASPGYIMQHDQVPKGRLKVVQDSDAAYFQPSLRDWSSFRIQPRTIVLG